MGKTAAKRIGRIRLFARTASARINWRTDRLPNSTSLGRVPGAAMIYVLLLLLGACAAVYLFAFVRQLRTGRRVAPRPEALALGAVTNFFDTLGIGSFAPTMAWLRFRRLADDRAIPITMILGYTPPTIAQSAIFLILLGARVDPWLLAVCIVAMLAGASWGVQLVNRVALRTVRLAVAGALTVAAAMFIATNLGLMPTGGSAGTLPPLLFALAVLAHVGLGVLLNFGVGSFAPTLVMLSLMGMDPRLAFPIMATAGALAVGGPASRHFANRTIDLQLVNGLALGAVPAVLVAAFVVKEMPLEMLRWLIVVMVLYAAAMLLWAALREVPEVPGETLTAR